MKKIIKLSIVILILGSFILAQNTQGVFGVEVGDQVKFKMLESKISVEFNGTAGSFSGFKADSTIIDVGTSFKVNVESITASELDWNSTIGSVTFDGMCPLALPIMDLMEFLVGYQLAMTYDIMTIYNGGEMTPVYLDVFYFDPFVDTAPMNWDMFEYIVTEQGNTLNVFYSGITDYDATCTTENNEMTFWWYFNFYQQMSPDPLTEMSIINDMTAIYDTTTGVLQEAIIDFQYNGTFGAVEMGLELDQHIVKSDQSDFVEFLDNNKWYFIGGGSGLIVLTLAIVIIVKIKKK
ncbi:MAG: hypothetical protein FK733_06585 [Asgard group archaeon]|nr:hypothetical protein [Asgard group archaeon]